MPLLTTEADLRQQSQKNQNWLGGFTASFQTGCIQSSYFYLIISWPVLWFTSSLLAASKNWEATGISWATRSWLTGRHTEIWKHKGRQAGKRVCMHVWMHMCVYTHTSLYSKLMKWYDLSITCVSNKGVNSLNFEHIFEILLLVGLYNQQNAFIFLDKWFCWKRLNFVGALDHSS